MTLCVLVETGWGIGSYAYTLDQIYDQAYPDEVKVTVRQEVTTYYRQLQEAASDGNALANQRRVYLARHLRWCTQQTEVPPTGDYVHLARVVEARRHHVWRLSHHHDQAVQLRSLLWFPNTTSIFVVVAGDKAGTEDTWYTAAAAMAEQRIDQILREQQGDTS